LLQLEKCEFYPTITEANPAKSVKAFIEFHFCFLN